LDIKRSTESSELQMHRTFKAITVSYFKYALKWTGIKTFHRKTTTEIRRTAFTTISIN
jgi:hypothetical protein